MTREKEVYQLWFDFLKRSKPFKAFCNWIHENKIDQSLLLSHPARGDEPLHDRYDSAKHYLIESKNLPGIEKFINSDGLFHHIVHCYLHNGDLFRQTSFEDWYKVRQSISNIKKNNKRAAATKINPSFILPWERDGLFIRIKPDAPDELIVRRAKQILKEYRTKDGWLLYNAAIIWLRPASRVRTNVLKRCLSVLDLTENGLTVKEIIQKIGNQQERRALKAYRPHNEGDEDRDDDPCYDSVIRKFLQYRSTAREIIQNVERGYFPRGGMMDK